MPEARAPGKLLICGEYAVLHGAPAIAAAVDVHANASVRRISGPDSLLVDHCTGASFPYRLSAGGAVHWRGSGPGRRGAVLEALFETMAAHFTAFDTGLASETCLDTDAFYATSNGEKVKLGLGSSAAVLVALAGALLATLGVEMEATHLRQLCCEAHRKFQAGQGSGVDVITAFEGGVVAVSLSAGLRSPDVRRLSLPEGLHIVPVWSGTSASTTHLLSRFDDYARFDVHGFGRHAKTLKDTAAAVLDAWRGARSADVLAGLRRYDATLQTMDREGGIGIYTPAHRKLARICAASGGLYKISGAGGGDFGLACTDSAVIMASLVKRLQAAGYSTLGAPGTARGLTVRPRPA